MNKRISLPGWIVAVLIINLIVLDGWLLRTRLGEQKENKNVLAASTSTCPSACISLINGGASSAKEQVISISASGTTIATDWTSITGSEITFNKASYKGAKKIYFQANLSSDASDRKAYVRLFDVTHGIGIQGSEITTTSTTLKQIQSGDLNPFSGDLTVKIQIKGLNGNLVTMSNPRIVVSY